MELTEGRGPPPEPAPSPQEPQELPCVRRRAVNQARVPMPADALDLNARRGTSGITVTPYTTLRLLNCRRRRAGALASLGHILSLPRPLMH